MVSQKNNPVSWQQLLYELSDANQHLKQLHAEMSSQGSIGIEEYRIALGHIYAHLNRAWHSRDLADQPTDAEWNELSRFPSDVPPVG